MSIADRPRTCRGLIDDCYNHEVAEGLDVARSFLTPLEHRDVILRGEPREQPRCVACRFIVLDGKHAADCPVDAYLARLSADERNA